MDFTPAGDSRRIGVEVRRDLSRQNPRKAGPWQHTCDRDASQQQTRWEHPLPAAARLGETQSDTHLLTLIRLHSVLQERKITESRQTLR